MKNENIQLVLLCSLYEVQLDESFILSQSYGNEKWEFEKKGEKSQYVQSEESWGGCCHPLPGGRESTHPPNENFRNHQELRTC